MQFKKVNNFDNNLIHDFNFNEDIEIMTDIFNCSFSELLKLVGIENIDSKENIDALYNYCYNHDLYINDIKWQEYKELLNNSNKVVLCHGSRSGIKGPIRLDVSGDSNDFSNGFYLGETLKQAGMFVSDEPNSSIYLMLLNKQGLRYTKFIVNTDWMLAIAYYRDIIKEYENHPRIQRIINRVNKSDYIIAPIADNRIFELIDAFIAKELTDKQTLYALSATHLGNQYVLKTQKAIDNLDILDHFYLCPVEKSIYNRSNSVESITSLNKAIIAKRKYKDAGRYIDELLYVNS